jgi:hypothetical protein
MDVQKMIALAKAHPAALETILNALETERHDNPTFVLEALAAATSGGAGLFRFVLSHPRLAGALASILVSNPDLAKAVSGLL